MSLMSLWTVFLPQGIGWPVLAVIAVVLVALYNTWARTFVITVVLVPFANLLWLFGVVAFVVWRPAAYVATLLFRRAAGHLAQGLETVAGRGGDFLRRGDRAAVARWYWNEQRFPFLYRPVPPDLVRPLYEDGKLIGGMQLAWLADRHMTRTALASTIIAGFTAGLILLLPALLQLLQAVSLSASYISHALGLPTPVLEQWPGQPAVLAPATWWRETAGADIERFLQTAGGIIYGSLIGWLLIAIGSALLTTIAALRYWHWMKSTPYGFATKDADVRWSCRIEAREVSNATYRRQIALSETYLADTPLYRIGRSTGSSRLRGDLGAPVRDQELCLDRDSLFQHLLVLGGTGEGKTTAILKPLMRQLMADRQHGFYVCDAKGVLWADALRVAEACGRADEVAVIGTAEGQFGVDPLANLNPTQVAATLRSVLRQVSGEGGDSFWPEMAANILRHVLTLALTYRLTEKGRQEKLEPYSLWWAYQAVIDKTKLAAVIVCIREYGDIIDADFNALLAGIIHQDGSEALAIGRSYDWKLWPHSSPSARSGPFV